MKKILSCVLAAFMIPGLIACSANNDTNVASDGDSTNTLLVGYGVADITPRDSVPLQGYGNTERRMSTGFWSEMYQVALAVTDADGNTAILIAADACWLENTLAEKIRFQIEQECGVPADQVVIAALHQHSAPDMYNNNAPSGITYRDTIFYPGAVKAAKAAMENRAPATVQVATVETENMNFVRRYLNSDGRYVGSESGDITPVSHETEVDNDLQLIRFNRKGQITMDGKEAKDIILANFQGHPHLGTNSKDTNAHSDMVGVFRDTIMKEMDCHAIYFSGAGGNVDMRSRIEEENKTSDYKAHGRRLARYVVNATDAFTDVNLTAVKATKMTFEGICNHSRDAEYAQAKEAYNVWLNTGDETLLKKYNYANWIEAYSVYKNYNRPESESFEIFALSFGDVAFVAAPYEMFDTNGMEIKENSPFKMTVIASIANGGMEYIPSAIAYEHGCYEVFATHFEAGTGELLRDSYLEMLKDLHSQY